MAEMVEMASNECNVCMDAFSAKRPPVTCPYCTQAACQACTERYILENAMEPLCACCKRGWGPTILDTLLTSKFRRGALRKQRAAALLEHERTLLPATQAVATARRRATAIATAHRELVTLRDGPLQVAPIERLRVRASHVDRMLKHMREEVERTKALGHWPTPSPHRVEELAALDTVLEALAATSRLRAEGMAASSAMRAALGIAPFVAPTLGAVHGLSTVFAQVAVAMKERVVPALASSTCVALCAPLQLETSRMHAVYALGQEATELRTVASVLGAVSVEDLARLAAVTATLVELGMPPADAGLVHLPTLPTLPTLEAQGGAGAESPPGFACKCPMDGCRGSVLRSTWQCVMCATVVCSGCREAMKDATHACDPAILANVRAIDAGIRAGETKCCPNCMVPVSRTYGCNHMFCVACHTAFDFSTGHRLRGMFHNPEHTEWLARRGVEAATPGGGAGVEARAGAPTVPGGAGVQAMLEREMACAAPGTVAAWPIEGTAALCRHMEGAPKDKRTQTVVMQLVAAHRCCVEVMQALPEAGYGAATYRELRIAYLLGELTDAQWAGALATAEGKRERNGHVRSALEVLLAVGADNFGHVLATDMASREAGVMLARALANLAAARAYVVEQLAEVKAQFGGSAVRVDNTWTLRG